MPQKAESTAVGNEATIGGFGTPIPSSWPRACFQYLLQRCLYFLTQGLVIKGMKNLTESLKFLDFKLVVQMGYV